MQYVYDNLDQGNTVISFFVDFSKAFDCVDHDLLPEKMSVCGVDGVAYRWIESCLSNTQQYVSLDSEVSGFRLITVGPGRARPVHRYK